MGLKRVRHNRSDSTEHAHTLLVLGDSRQVVGILALREVMSHPAERERERESLYARVW